MTSEHFDELPDASGATMGEPMMSPEHFGDATTVGASYEEPMAAETMASPVMAEMEQYTEELAQAEGMTSPLPMEDYFPQQQEPAQPIEREAPAVAPQQAPMSEAAYHNLVNTQESINQQTAATYAQEDAQFDNTLLE
jgi:hypothetical protein